ncbi:MAG: sigma-B regulation protein RsbU (phosphoserine phosphatase) [Verrucomicrobiales bacterium]|jgi:sigma-B regulation protein RsbU (phosphoserine phosphatase)
MVYIALLLLGICALLGALVWKQRLSITRLKEKRKEIVVEEHRMFSFLHGLGEALQTSRTRAEFYQFILNGAIGVVKGQHGALYLLDDRESVLVPQAVSSDCPPLTVDLLQEYDPTDPSKQYSAIQLRNVHHHDEKTILGDCLAERACLHLHDLFSHAAYEDASVSDREKLQASAMLAPLYFGERDIGVIIIIRDARFSGNDFAVFRSLSDQCALALGTAQLSRQSVEQQRLKEELLTAREVQRILLPDKAPPLKGYRIAGNNEAARTVSGDYYDFIHLGKEHLGIAIADVSGKGLPASLMMAMGRSVLRANAEPWFSPAKALAVVNRILYPDMREDMFVSMVYLIAKGDSGEIVMARAGHDPPMIYRAATKTIEEADPPGLAVGVDEGPIFERDTKDFRITLEAGDCLVLYTDGINEAQDSEGDEFGLEQMREIILEAAPQGADHLMAQLYAKVEEFVGEYPQTDDMTLVVLEKT